jgi:hypothetical protein
MKHACQRHGIGWDTTAWLTQSLTVRGSQRLCHMPPMQQSACDSHCEHCVYNLDWQLVNITSFYSTYGVGLLRHYGVNKACGNTYVTATHYIDRHRSLRGGDAWCSSHGQPHHQTMPDGRRTAGAPSRQYYTWLAEEPMLDSGCSQLCHHCISTHVLGASTHADICVAKGLLRLKASYITSIGESRAAAYLSPGGLHICARCWV